MVAADSFAAELAEWKEAEERPSGKTKWKDSLPAGPLDRGRT